jgi:flagellar biogenesis protein FliO
MGFAIIAAACVALAAPAQDAAVGPAGSADAVTVTLPPALSSQSAEPVQAAPEPPAPPRAIPAEEPRRAPRPLEERAEPGPSVGGFVIGSFAVVGFLGAAFLLLRRFGKNSRLLGAGGALKVIARKPLGRTQEILLVEVGAKVFMIGSTREHLSTLGEFASPDEIAMLRADLPERRDDSHRTEFSRSLREGIREEEGSAEAKSGPREEKVFASIADELAEIRKTVRAWRA